MEVKPTLAHGLQNSIGVLWKSDDLYDFTVVVDGTSFQCHRLILKACSGFFQGLFRSQMKECQENQVKFQGMTANTFDVILNSVYKGVDGLTVDNVLDVWSATEQLQIRYLTEECENFAIENVSVENCCSIFWHAWLYSAEKVRTHALDVMSKHFEQVRNMGRFLELPFDDFYRVIESDSLIASSEDVVVETVLNWVDYTQHDLSDCTSDCKEHHGKKNSQSTLPATEIDQTGSLSESVNDSENSTSAQPVPGHCQRVCQNNILVKVQSEREDRKQHIFTLMTTCRLCLISSSCLENLFHSPALLSCKEALNLVTDAMMYKLCVERRHDTWPEAATHRVASNMKHVMVFMSNNKFWAYSLISGSVKEFADLPDDYICNSAIIIFDNELYIGYRCKQSFSNININTFKMFQSNKSWQVINNINLNYINCKLLAHGNRIYYLGNSGFCYCNCQYGCRRDWFQVSNQRIQGYALICFKQYILIINLQNEGLVCVQYYNTKTRTTHTSSSAMDGTSAGMVSFTHLGDVFLLQRNGSLWKVCSTGKEEGWIKKEKEEEEDGSTDIDSVDFKLVSKLWDKDIDLKGCVVYRKELFVFYHEKEPTGETHLGSVPDLFRNIKLVAVNSESSCLPMVLPESWLIVNNSKV